jgi:hypothetical protein
VHAVLNAQIEIAPGQAVADARVQDDRGERAVVEAVGVVLAAHVRGAELGAESAVEPGQAGLHAVGVVLTDVDAPEVGRRGGIRGEQDGVSPLALEQTDLGVEALALFQEHELVGVDQLGIERRPRSPRPGAGRSRRAA